MRRVGTQILHVLILTLLAVACSGGKDTGFPPTPTPSESETGGEGDVVATSEVGVDGVAFVPLHISVAPGTEVSWAWSGSIPHNVISDDDLFDSGDDVTEDTFTFTFDEPGEYQYFCEVHGTKGGVGMFGIVTVE
ncbi:MAG TPA: plastocyanin/azurin family copper-binding protein [Actinomycetota bacterium]